MHRHARDDCFLRIIDQCSESLSLPECLHNYIIGHQATKKLGFVTSQTIVKSFYCDFEQNGLVNNEDNGRFKIPAMIRGGKRERRRW